MPMLAKRVDDVPEEGAWIFEPKWDGFRALIFRDGDELMIQSRDQKPLDRYFPELAEPLKAQLPERCVLDGEIVIAASSGLDFDALQLRIHPAASRIKLLSQQIPASVVVFDLLWVIAICAKPRSSRDAPNLSRCSLERSRRFTSRPQRTTRRQRATGSNASKAQASMG